MPRFYFHVKNRDRLIEDGDGSDLPDADHAIQEGLVAARELLAEAIRAGREPMAEALVIADGRGQEIRVVPLAEVLPKKVIGH